MPTVNIHTASIEVGLSALVKHARPGQTLKLDEIAEVCGCSKQTVFIEQSKALKKLRDSDVLRAWVD